jgi:hypothetical protein
VDTRKWEWPWEGADGVGAVVHLLVRLDAYACVPVLHTTGFVGLRGHRLRAVPDRLWHQLQLVEPTLVRLLQPQLTPFRRRLPGKGRG